MDAAAPQMFDVTFYNVFTCRRGLVIDNVTESEADAIVAQFSDKNNAYLYLPEVRKEPAKASA